MSEPVRKRTRRDEPTQPIPFLPSRIEYQLADLAAAAHAGDDEAAARLSECNFLLDTAPAAECGRPVGVEPKRMTLRELVEAFPSYPDTSYGLCADDAER